MQTDPILIVGAGAIGAVVGAHLIRTGHEVDFAEVNAAHVEAVRRDGLAIEGATQMLLRPDIFLPEEVTRTYPLILLAVKAPATHSALPLVARALAKDGCVVSLQNGLEEYKIADAVGAGRTIGAYLTFGGFYVAPGRVKHGGNGSFKIGEIDGRTTPRVQALAALLSALQPVDVTDNIFGYLWAKMALGAVYFGTAITDADVVDVYDRPIARTVLERLCGEVVAVADAMGVRTQTSDGFDPKVFRADATDEAARSASWDAQRRYWGAHDNQRTGVWRDLAIHKRPTEVDHQILPVIEHGRRVGVPTPMLERLRAVIKRIEAGEATLGMERLEELSS